LINKHRSISELRPDRADCRTAQSSRGSIYGIAIMPVFIGFLHCCETAQAPALLTQAGISLNCTRPRVAAHIRGRPALAVPICLDRHNFATETFANLRRTPDTWAAAENDRTAKANGITRPSPAEELGKRWRFFPTYAEV
jgi:hypothetical protein